MPVHAGVIALGDGQATAISQAYLGGMGCGGFGIV